MKKQTLRKFAGLVTTAVVWMGANASANASLSFTIDKGNAALAGDPTPFGTVEVTRTSANTAAVSLLAASGYSFGDGTTLALNLTGGGTFTVGSFSGYLQDGTTPISTTYGPNNDQTYSVSTGNISEFGTFTFALNTHDGAGFAASSLMFTITTTGSGWASEADILEPNTLGYQVAGHVFPVDSSLATGFASTTPVPEPSTVVAGLLLLVPLGLSTVRIVRRNRAR